MSENRFGFESLKVWEKSIQLVKFIYKLTSDFPKEEQYSLTSQIRRSAISIPSNIAEGTSRDSKKDKKRFYTIAYGSLMELVNQIIITKELSYISTESSQMVKDMAMEIAKMISGLKKSV
ncbi:S23 ribosomal protein [Galbibacter orientalis DSM 19592]|uniref:S23 ribosomal protein n=1 Tax=Galbibacter orientalis DSM 19592 TaxID=926559 RepID=I3C6G9_9FLAO|nr:four helix bundle protein [Galbibacter orientalis]EIJ39212.1 S23 ribosomal protein [Galbibacter orientalis DSM 19592]